MALKKSELYSSLWSSCDELRGGMDASQYKDYVLVLLFVKYVSDKYAGQKDAMVEIDSPSTIEWNFQRALSSGFFGCDPPIVGFRVHCTIAIAYFSTESKYR